MPDDGTSISVKEPVRDELPRYRAEDGLTHDDAIARLIETVGWIDDQEELILQTKDQEDLSDD